ncbi:MAG TPA: hypothetical protein VFK10_06725 [Burkholderiaceae bacterium]|nr:hypothetical protein [Burkholderiaceae bacterium]
MPPQHSAEANFFASLVNPSEVIAACEKSTALNALTSKRHSADRPGRKRNNELAAWDAAVDEGKSEAEWRRRNLVGVEDVSTGGVKLVEVACA